MSLTRIDVKPGIIKDVTAYTARNAWIDSQWVRFNKGMPEKMGGWSPLPTTGSVPIQDVHNAMVYTTNDGVEYTLFSTPVNLKVINPNSATNEVVDITPSLGTVAYAGANTFDPTSGTTNVIVNLAAAPPVGTAVGTVVYLSPSPGTVGGITVPAEVTVTTVGATSFTFDLSSAALNSTNVVTAGSAIFLVIDPATFISSGYYGTGYYYGTGPYGSSSSSTMTSQYWSMDTFGQLAIACRDDVGPVIWSTVAGAAPTLGTDRAILMSQLTGMDDTNLTAAHYILMSGSSRHIILLGANEEGTTTYNPLLIRWCSQEDPTTWTTSSTNTAGSIPVTDGSFLVCGQRTKREILIWSDTALISMQYLGGQDVFGVQTLATNISIASQRAVAVQNDIAYWMGTDKFYYYNGRVEELDCTVLDHIMLNLADFRDVHCGLNLAFNEIIWFYTTATGTKYATYNYAEQVWSTGALDRTMWYDTASLYYPLAAKQTYLISHETGTDGDDGDGSGSNPIEAYIESGDIDLEDGEQFLFVRRIIPDVDFGNSSAEGNVTLTLYPRRAPGAAIGGASTPAGEADATTVAITPYTERIPIRLRARQVRVRVGSDATGIQWRLGTQRVDTQPDGRR